MEVNISNHNKIKKIQYARLQNMRFLREVKDYFESMGFSLPYDKKKFYEKVQLMYGKCEGGEINDFAEKVTNHLELANCYYTILGANKLPIIVDIKGGEIKGDGIFFSRNRFDQIWLSHKPKLIRAVWQNAVKEAQLMDNYQALHLTLTVPHADGEWKGKKFYARELLQCFTKMRRQQWWKNSFFGGEYNMEISQQENSKNGLHIHIHALVFVYKQVKIEGLRERLQKEWNNLSGATQIRLEDLYIYKRKNNGQIVKKDIPYAIVPLENGKKSRLKCDYFKNEFVSQYGESFVNVAGQLCNFEEVKVREKFYLKDSWNTGSSREEQETNYQSAIMEAIKYNFKMDSLKYDTPEEGKTFKVELIAEILRYSKYFRFHGKFGEFYGKGSVAKYFKYQKDDDDSLDMIKELQDNGYDEQYIAHYMEGYEQQKEYRELLKSGAIEIPFEEENSLVDEIEQRISITNYLEELEHIPANKNLHFVYPENLKFSKTPLANGKFNYHIVCNDEVLAQFIKIKRVYQDKGQKRFVIQAMAKRRIEEVIDDKYQRKHNDIKLRFFEKQLV